MSARPFACLRGDLAEGLAVTPAWLSLQWPVVTVLGPLSPTPLPAAVLCRAGASFSCSNISRCCWQAARTSDPQSSISPGCFPHAHAQAEGASPHQSDRAPWPGPASCPRQLSQAPLESGDQGRGQSVAPECGSPRQPTLDCGAGPPSLQCLSDQDAQAEQLAQSAEPAARSGLTPSCLGPGVFIFWVPQHWPWTQPAPARLPSRPQAGLKFEFRVQGSPMPFPRASRGAQEAIHAWATPKPR